MPGLRKLVFTAAVAALCSVPIGVGTVVLGDVAHAQAPAWSGKGRGGAGFGHAGLGHGGKATKRATPGGRPSRGEDGFTRGGPVFGTVDGDRFGRGGPTADILDSDRFGRRSVGLLQDRSCPPGLEDKGCFPPGAQKFRQGFCPEGVAADGCMPSGLRAFGSDRFIPVPGAVRRLGSDRQARD